MALAQSMYTAISGIKAYQTRTNVIGDNIANVNTVGFKRGAQAFRNMFSKSLQSVSPETTGRGATNGINIGLGVYTDRVDTIFKQGNLEQTGRALDMAIQGNGFFMVQGADGDPGDLYTRNGSLYLGGEQTTTTTGTTQDLLTEEGLHVQGYNATDGILGSSLEAIALPAIGFSIDGVASTTASIGGNLNSGQSVNLANEIPTGGASTWLSTNNSTINVGRVLTSASLWAGAGIAAGATTDLASLEYTNGATQSSVFNNLQVGDEISVGFKKGTQSHTSQAFTYGTTGTTLGEFATWLTGGLGDDGTPTTERLDGGVLGTLRYSERTVAADGFAAPAEQAGAYLRSVGGETKLSIACNLGAVNALSDLSLIHNDATLSNVFSTDTSYPNGIAGGDAAGPVSTWQTDSNDNVINRQQAIHFSLVSRDNTSSTWRWTIEGGTSETAPALVSDSGLVRFNKEIDSTTGSQVLTFVQEQSTSGITYDMDNLRQLATANDVNVTEQDGYPEGYLDTYSVDTYGTIQGAFTNGVTTTLAKLGMSLFMNPMGMTQITGTLFAAEEAITGEAIVNSATTSDTTFGTVRNGFLESSNVDLSHEMSDLILTQRGYQFDSKIVSTTDEMLQLLVQLKR